jgi:hypothetical protein
MGRGETWYDNTAGPLVRPYAVTRGRTDVGMADVQMITLVVALRQPAPGLANTLEPEHTRILAMCRRPTSVAEISAEIRQPIGVVKILIGDLLEHGLISLRSAAAPNRRILEAVLSGIQRL